MGKLLNLSNLMFLHLLKGKGKKIVLWIERDNANESKHSINVLRFPLPLFKNLLFERTIEKFLFFKS